MLELDLDGTYERVLAYRTGDLGQLRGGHVEILGRIDKQVKVRGIRTADPPATRDTRAQSEAVGEITRHHLVAKEH